jgi:hypothetical protein
VELAFGHLRPGRSVLRRGGDGAGSIHKLTYLRGLDGLLAGSGTKTEGARGGQAAQGENRLAREIFPGARMPLTAPARL